MQNTSPMITKPFSGERVWNTHSALEVQTRFSFSGKGVAEKCAEELAALAEAAASGSAPVENGIPLHCSLDACSELAASVRTLLDQGPGFAVMDDFPIAGGHRRFSLKLSCC